MAFDPGNFAMQVTPDMAFSGLDASNKIQQARLAAAQAYQANQSAAQTGIQNKYLGPTLAAKLQEEQNTAQYAPALSQQDLLNKQYANQVAQANGQYAMQAAKANVGLTNSQAAQAQGTAYNQGQQGNLAAAQVPLQKLDTGAKVISAIGTAGNAFLGNLNNPMIQAAVSSDKSGALSQQIGSLLNNYVSSMGGINGALFSSTGGNGAPPVANQPVANMGSQQAPSFLPAALQASLNQAPGIGGPTAAGMPAPNPTQQIATSLALQNAASQGAPQQAPQPSVQDSANAVQQLAAGNQATATRPPGSTTMVQMGQRANNGLSTMMNAFDNGASRYFGPLGQVKLREDYAKSMMGDKSVIPNLTAWNMYTSAHSDALAGIAGIMNTPANAPAQKQLNDLINIDPYTTPANLARSQLASSIDIVRKTEAANKLSTADLYDPAKSEAAAQNYAKAPSTRKEFNFNGKQYNLPESQWEQFAKLTPQQQAQAIASMNKGGS